MLFDMMPWVANIMDFETRDDEYPISRQYRYKMAFVVLINIVVTFLYEKVVIWYLTLWWNGVTQRKIERDFAK
jgi:hypothetical protein